MTVQVGFSRVNVTPPLGIAMAGHPGEKQADGVLDDLYARAMVVRAESDAFAVASVDVVFVNDDSVARIRQRVARSAISGNAGLVVEGCLDRMGRVYPLSRRNFKPALGRPRPGRRGVSASLEKTAARSPTRNTRRISGTADTTRTTNAE